MTTVAEMIEKLRGLPQDAEFVALYDGSCETSPDHVFLSRGGRVIMASGGEPVYFDEDRPLDAPTWEDDECWELPECTPVDTPAPVPTDPHASGPNPK